MKGRNWFGLSGAAPGHHIGLMLFTIILVMVSGSLCYGEETDISNLVQVNLGRPLYDYTALQTYTAISLTNTSDTRLEGPMKLVIASITTDAVTVANAAGVLSGGEPYLEFSSSLDPGDTSAAQTLRFDNPDGYRFSFTTQVLGEVAAENQAPTAYAGEDQEHTLDAGQSEMTVTLDGSASTDSDGTIAAYRWSGDPDPDDVVAPTLSMEAGTYEFSLVVEDDLGLESEADTVLVTINAAPNQAPVADAGDDITVWVMPGQEAQITLDGTGSSDPDGDTLSTFSWTGDPDPEDIAAPTVSVSAGVYTFTLIVYDADETASSPDTVTVTVSEYSAPVLSVTQSEYSVNEGEVLTFDVSATDADGDAVTLSAAPQLTNAEFASVTAVDPSAAYLFSPGYDQAGTYTVTFTATDAAGLMDERTVTITVADVNRAPTANALEVAVAEDTPVDITLTASDPDLDALTFTVTSQPENGALSGTVPDLSYTPNLNFNGTDSFDFTVEDGNGGSHSAIVTISVLAVNDLPVADAGQDQQTLVGEAVTLNGAGSTDADGDALEYTWSLASAPEDSAAALSDTAIASPVITPDLPGTYNVQLVVYDGFDNSEPDTVTIEAEAGAALQLTPETLELSTLDSGSLTVSLAEPAAAGGQVIQLFSSNTAIATVPESVTIAQGETAAVLEVTTLSSEGTATVTASADDIGEHSATVNVSLRAMVLTIDNPLIGTDRSSPATIQLALPAPARGTTVSITTSDPAVASVSTSSIEIAEGDTTATFQINGLATGAADISLAAPAYATVSTEVQITEEMILLGDLETLAPDQVGSLPVILSAAAPVGGITVTLTSSNPEVATVSASVTVAEGETIASTNAQVTGVSFGTTTITASAPGYAPDYAEVPVTLTLSFSPTSVTVTAGQTTTLTLGLSAPAPSAGLTLDLTSDDAELATVPDSITIASGQSSVQVTVTGVAQGSTQIQAGATGLEAVTASVQVTAPPAISINNYDLGYNLQLRTSFLLQQVAPSGGVTVTLTSADPSKLLLSTGSATVGSASISMNISAGGYRAYFYLQSLADDGTVQITASAPGYADGTSEITLVPTGFWIGPSIYCPSSCPDSFETSAFDGNKYIYVGVYSPYGTQTIRAGLTVEVPVTSSNPEVGDVTDASVALSQNEYRTRTEFDPLTAGTTTLAVVQPEGFTALANVNTEITADVAAPSVELTSTTIVGEDLQKYLDFDLGGTPPDPVDVTITVADETVALLTADIESAGSGQITLSDVDVSSLPGIYVQGLSQGTTTVSVSATGYTSATGTIEVYPSGFYFTTSNASFDMYMSETETLYIATAALSPDTLNYYESQNIRGGLSVAVEVTSSDTAVGVITSSPVTIPGGSGSGSTVFEALAAGTTTLSLVQPDGFDLRANWHHELTANVSTPGIRITTGVLNDDDVICVGKDLQTSYFSYRMDVYPDTLPEITFSVADSSIALITDNRTEEGVQSIVTTSYFGSVRLYLQGLQEGSTTLTVSAPGYLPSTYPLEVMPSGFILSQPSADFTTDVFADNTRVRVYPGYLTRDTYEYYSSQELRAGITAEVSVVSSDTRVGTITESPLTFYAGLYPAYLTTYFDPLAGGSTTLSVVQPDGFTQAADRTQVTATVEASDINMNASVTVGKNLQKTLVVTLESTPPEPVDVIVSVVDANVTIISDQQTTMGSDTITFHDVSDTASLYVYVQGLEVGDTELRAQATGFNDAVTAVAVDPAALYIAYPYNNFTKNAADPNIEVSVFTARLDRTTLEYGCTFQASASCWEAYNCVPYEVGFCTHPEIRGGLTLEVPIQSSDPSVGALSAASLTLVGGQDYSQTVALDLAGSGETTISITPPTGFAVPANRDLNITGTVKGISSSPSLEAFVGRNYSYDVDASHPAEDHVFLLAAAPTGMTIDETNGLIDWLPDESQVGDITVTVQLYDDDELVDAQSYTITVLAVDPDNTAPMIVSGPIDRATEETAYTYQVRAVDNDEGEVLSYFLSTAPDGMSMDAATGLVSWTPGAETAGEYVVVVGVQDVAGASATQQYLLTVSTSDALDGDFDGYTTADGDCDDTDASIHPGAVDIAANDIDEDCDGQDALLSVLFKAGTETLRIPVGTSAYVGYSFDFKTVDSGDYVFSIDEQIAPDTGGITIDAGLPATLSASGSQWSHLGQQITANIIGTYELTTTVTDQDTGDTAQAVVVVQVTAGVDVPVLKPVGSDPDAIPIAQAEDVIFTVMLVNTQKVPDSVVLEQTDAAGSPIAVLGELVDDGSQGDLSAGDLVFSGTFNLYSETEGDLHYRARAVFDDGAEEYIADTCIVGVTRFPIDVVASQGTVVTHPETGEPMISDRVMVSFVTGTTPDAIESVAASVDGTVVGTLYRLGFYAVQVPDTGDTTGVLSAVAALQTQPEVETAETVSVSTISATALVAPNDRYFFEQQFDEDYSEDSPIYTVRADEAWIITRGGVDNGSGPAIAIIDSGIDRDHPEFIGNIRRGTNYQVPRTDADRFHPWDDNGHGTFVAGIAAADADNGIGIAGVAWGGPILVYKVTDMNGTFTTNDLSASAIRSAADRGAKVINMSYGSYHHNSDEEEAVDYAFHKGSLLVAAAGNDGVNRVTYPASLSNVIAVGAIEAKYDGTVFLEYIRAGYSNFGSWVDLAAPAVSFSTIPLDRYAFIGDTNAELCPDVTKAAFGCYGQRLTGTSFSAPVVSGAADLVWDANPQLDNQQVRELLVNTAIALAPNTRLGTGRLDVFEAVFNGSFEADWHSTWSASAQKYIPPSGPSSYPVADTINAIEMENGTSGYTPRTHPFRGQGEANRNMLYIGNDGGGISQTTVSRTFTVQEGVYEIPFSFDYYFLSEEVPEYLDAGECSRCTCDLFDDYFNISVTSPVRETSYSLTGNISDFPINDPYQSGWESWPSTTLNIGEPGADVRPYDLGDYLYDTPLTNVCTVTENLNIGVFPGRVINALIPIDETGVYTISISINDAADMLGDSAIVIDNIRFRPE